MDTEVRLKKGEPIDRALRKLKKKLDKEGTLKELRNRLKDSFPDQAPLLWARCLCMCIIEKEILGYEQDQS